MIQTQSNKSNTEVTFFMHFFNISVFHIHNKYIKLSQYDTALNIFTLDHPPRNPPIKMSLILLFIFNFFFLYFVTFVVSMPSSKPAVISLYNYLQVKNPTKTKQVTKSCFFYDSSQLKGIVGVKAQARRGKECLRRNRNILN